MIDRREIQRMLDDLPATLAKVAPAMAEWTQREFSGSAADGEIVATVDFVGQLKDLQIGILAKRRLDNITLGDEILTAIQNAETEAEQRKWDMLAGLRVGKIALDELMRDGPASVQKLLRDG